MGPGLAEAQLIRWVFAGGKPQGEGVLRRAIDGRWPPAAIVWPPDLPAADVAALRDLAEAAGIPASPSANLEERVEDLRRCDLLVTCRFGLLRPPVFEAPRLGAVNVHASLLPRYRGVHPVAWALIRGEPVTGVTVHRIDAGVDTGPVLHQVEVPIDDGDDIWSLTGKLDAASADAVEAVLRTVLRTGRLPPSRPQSGEPSRAPRRRPEDGRIDWSMPPRRIHDLCRALRPPLPPAFAFTDAAGRVEAVDSRLPADGGELARVDGPGMPPGTVVAAGAGGWCAVACGGGILHLRTEPPLAAGMRLS